MYLLIDGQALQTPCSRNRGIGRFARNLIAALVQVRPDWRLEIIESDHLEPINREHTAELRIRSFHPPLAFEPQNQDANKLYFGDWITAQAADALLVPSLAEPWGIAPEFTGCRPPVFGVLHDLIPLMFHRDYLTQPAWLETYARLLRQQVQVDCLFSNSHHSAWDVSRLFQDPIPRLVTIGGGIDPSFTPLTEAEMAFYRYWIREKFGLHREFLFYLGAKDPRKNVMGALYAYAALPVCWRDRFDLAIACPLEDHVRSFLLEAARQLGLSTSLKLLGTVTETELRGLYQLCRLFLFPSLYEGLGFPLLEALQCGAPVVAYKVASVPEYAGEVCRLAEPPSPEAFAEAMVAALEEPRDQHLLKRQEHASSFRWENSAEIASQTIEALTPELRINRPRRRRLAWISPLPPAPSGIADYSAELLPYLAEWYDIDLVVDPEQPVVQFGLAKSFPLLLGNEVLTRHEVSPYDLFIYHIGNSRFHVYMLDLMRRCPGLVVLHDYFLGGLVLSAMQAGAWPVSLDEELAFEGEECLRATLRSGTISKWDVMQFSPLNRRILAGVEGVIVHSQWTWERTRGRTPSVATRIPHHVSLPQLGTRAAERDRLQIPQDAFIIATLGIVGEPKRVPSLLRAVAQLPMATRGRSQVLVVGECPAGLRQELGMLADDLGISSLVRFLGRVAFSDFTAYARAADVCVQLRYPTRGETSGALLRALSAGAACVVADCGSIAELPHEVAWKVRTPDYEVEDLAGALQRLYQDPGLRDTLGQAALRFVSEHHEIRSVAAQYAATIDTNIARREATDTPWRERAIAALARCTDLAAAEAVIEPWTVLREQARRAAGFPAIELHDSRDAAAA